MENVTIRKLKKEDADSIAKIQAAITKKPIQDSFRQVIEEQSDSPGVASFVAEQEGRVLGFMISYLLMGGFGIEKSAWIASLGVDPKFMDQGIGKSLAEEIFNYYNERGIKNIYTSVRWDSTDLLSFFKTLGFDRSHFINLRRVLE